MIKDHERQETNEIESLNPKVVDVVNLSDEDLEKVYGGSPADPPCWLLVHK